MKERPILFSAPMVRAILDGGKTQTRRLLKPSPSAQYHSPRVITGSGNGWGFSKPNQGIEPFLVRCPYGESGDRLWVRENIVLAPPNWADPIDATARDDQGRPRHLSYFADHGVTEAARDYGLKVTPSIHMPRWASRITLEIVEVRVQRLQDISEHDAAAEGVSILRMQSYDHERRDWFNPDEFEAFDSIRKYRLLWDLINGVGSWRSNPWVWAVTFARVPKVSPYTLDGSDPDYIYFSTPSTTRKDNRHDLVVNKGTGKIVCTCEDAQYRRKEGDILRPEIPACKHVEGLHREWRRLAQEAGLG